MSFEATPTLRLDMLIQNVRASVGAKLGVSAHRIKLLNDGEAGLLRCGGQVLKNSIMCDFN